MSRLNYRLIKLKLIITMLLIFVLHLSIHGFEFESSGLTLLCYIARRQKNNRAKITTVQEQNVNLQHFHTFLETKLN